MRLSLLLVHLCSLSSNVLAYFNLSPTILCRRQLKLSFLTPSSESGPTTVQHRITSRSNNNNNNNKSTTTTTSKCTSTSTTVLQMTSFSEEQLEKIPPRRIVQLGMQYFKQGDIDASIELFDNAEKLDSSLRPYLWQRGISYYYANRFREGSDQFRYDVKVNPLDVEEIVWDIACQMGKTDSEVVNMMSLPKGKNDRRKIMSTVYSLFRGDGATEHDLVDAGHTGSISDEFYSLFYLGLYTEARGENAKAENYMRAAVKSSYAQGFGSNDYMTSVAKVHCKTRGWLY